MVPWETAYATPEPNKFLIVSVLEATVQEVGLSVTVPVLVSVQLPVISCNSVGKTTSIVLAL